MAPGASIIDYNIPDLSDNAILNGLTTIIEANKADVVNMSFGGGEIFYTPAFNGGQDFTSILVVYDDLFAQGNRNPMNAAQPNLERRMAAIQTNMLAVNSDASR